MIGITTQVISLLTSCRHLPYFVDETLCCCIVNEGGSLCIFVDGMNGINGMNGGISS